MKKNLLFLGVALAFLNTVLAQQPDPASLKKTFSVKEICKAQWDNPEGLPYKKVTGTNLGVTSFETVDKDRIAFYLMLRMRLLSLKKQAENLLLGLSYLRYPVILFMIKEVFMCFSKIK